MDLVSVAWDMQVYYNSVLDASNTWRSFTSGLGCELLKIQKIQNRCAPHFDNV